MTNTRDVPTDEEVLPLLPRVSWSDALRRQFGSAPWWIISTAIHIMALILMTLITVGMPPEEEEQIVILTDFREPETEIPKYHRPDLFKDTPVKETFQDPEVETQVEIEDIEELAEQVEPANPEAICDIPDYRPGIGIIGVGPGPTGIWSGRSGVQKQRALDKYHAPEGTEDAVSAALNWLARHQEPDGRWDGEKYEGDDCDGGLTGLASLAFLAAGHTERAGDFKKTMRKAVRWMISQQEENGAVAIHYTGAAYNHAICGLALAEAYGMTRILETGRAAQKAVDYSTKVHQSPRSGWRYSPKQDADISVTGWFVMQLKSAKLAGLAVDTSGFQGALNFLDEVTEQPGNSEWEPGGRCSYLAGRSSFGSHRRTSMGLLCRQFLGYKTNEWQVAGAAAYVDRSLPEWETHDFYYWYYASLTQFQMRGGYWKRWNERMSSVLMGHQRKGGDEDGSWDPGDSWMMQKGGRVMSTALGTLCLEVYYRYLYGFATMGR